MSRLTFNNKFLISQGRYILESFSSYWKKQEFNRGKLVLTFDDALAEVYSYGLPVLVEKGVHATFFVNNLDALTGHHVTWAQLLEMHQAGMDIQCHTNSHPANPYLADLTTEQIIAQITGVTNAFAAHGLPAPVHHGYPSGSYNDKVVDAIFNLRQTARTTNEGMDRGLFNKFADKYHLPTLQIDVINEARMTLLKSRMLLAQQTKQALIFFGHNIGPNSTYGSTTQVADLITIIDYARSIGVDVVSMEELNNHLVPIELKARYVSNTESKIDWWDRRSNNSIYVIERKAFGGEWAEIDRTENGATTFSDSDIPAGDYYYRVRRANDLVYSAEVNAQRTVLTITSTGTGAGVATMTMDVHERQVITLDGNARFYTNAACTEGESTSWDIWPGINSTMYVKCTSGSSNMIIPHPDKIKEITAWTSATNAPTLGGSLNRLVNLSRISWTGNSAVSFDISRFTKLTYIEIPTGNTVSGTIAGLINLSYLRIVGATTLTGSITALTKMTHLETYAGASFSGSITGMTNLAYIHVESANTISGNLTNLTALTHVYLHTGNTVTGDITNLSLLIYLYLANSTSINGSITGKALTCLYVAGTNLITGDLTPVIANISWLYLPACAMTTYVGGATWKNLSFTFNPSAGYGLPVPDYSRMIIDLSNSSSLSAKTLTIRGSNASLADTAQGGIWGTFSGETSPSALAVAYKNLIKVKTCSLLLNGVQAPGASGDGTGFPAGFGNWYRS